MDTDAIIIKQVLNGNTAKFEQLVTKYSRKVFALAISILKNTEDAEEITQNTFLKVFNSLEKFRGDAKLSSYLYRVCYNESLNHLRTKKNFIALEPSSLNEESIIHPIFYDLEKTELKEYLEKALSMIHRDYSMVLTMFYLEEQSHKEIIQFTGWSPAAVKVKLHNARKALESTLSKLLQNEAKNLY